MRRAVVVLSMLGGCLAAEAEGVAPRSPEAEPERLSATVAEPVAEPVAALEPAPTPEAPAVSLAEPPPVQRPSGEVPAEESPLGTRLRERTTIVYASPSKDASVQGRIPPYSAFLVYEFVEGRDCRGEGWARVETAGFACLERAQTSASEPSSVLADMGDELVPFVYARPRNRKKDDAGVPRYRSRRAMNRGDAPEDSLVPWGTYAFDRRHGNGPNPAVLLTPRKRAVPLEQMRRLRPSSFAGLDLDDSQGVEALARHAWVIDAPTALRESPRLNERAFAALPFHAAVEVVGEDHEADGTTWRRVIGTSTKGERVEGWVERSAVRRLRLVTPPAGLAENEVWLDIDLREQTLVVHRGSSPVFATLISSGRRKDPTPLGVFRIESKHAYTNMQSLADADDPYFVEAVPWAQYFQGRYALHGVYWHDRFGRPASHGCINLAPRDARRVFELTTPGLPEGWLHVHAHAASAGTVVRVRRDDADVPDRRAARAADG